MFIVRIFWNSDERRLRSFWRILATSILILVVAIIIAIPILLVVGLEEDEEPGLFTSQLIATVAIFLMLPVATRFFDRRKFSDTGVHFNKGWWIDLCFGLVLGAAMMSVIFGVMLGAGWVTVTETLLVESGRPLSLALIMSMGLFLSVGITEELLFRGYLLLNVAEGLNFSIFGSRGALIVSWILTSAIFGIAHLLNPDATTFAAINIALAGLWLGLGYVLTGSLAIPIGLHVSWNFFQGVVFGYSVSGMDNFEPRLLVLEDTGPELWTGGTFGPEGGLLGTLALLVGTFLVAAWIQLRTGRLGFHTALAESPERSMPEQASFVSGADTGLPPVPGEPEVESKDFTEPPPPPKG